jgi:hypothetical protein
MNLSSDFEDETILPTIDTFSPIAKIRFIADSSSISFTGSNEQECAEIDFIRHKYADYLYDDNPPQEIIDNLLPIADKLLGATDRKSLWVIGLYNPIGR